MPNKSDPYLCNSEKSRMITRFKYHKPVIGHKRSQDEQWA